MTGQARDTASGPRPAIDVEGRLLRAPKGFTHGTHRTVAPEETLERIRPHFPRMGITRLADVTGLDRLPVSTVLAMRPNSRTLANGSGKGFTKVSATVSAAMETIELHHAEYAELDPVRATWNDVAVEHEIIGVQDLQLTEHSLFSVDQPEQWVQGWDVVARRPVYVPLLAVDMGPPQRSRDDELTSFQMGSNGLASGNVLLEAVAAALYEVVERDATTRWKVATEETGVHPPEVRLDTVHHDLPRNLLQRLDQAGVDVVLEDCTTDTHVPVFKAMIADRRADLGFFGGYGAHLDPAIAMVRALTEAVQSRVVYVSGTRDDVFDHSRHLMKRRENDQVRARVHRRPPSHDATTLVGGATSSFEGDVGVVIDHLRAVGLHQVIVVDLTRPEFEIPVVRVIVPGLEGYKFPFYTPGRRARAFLDEVRTLADELGVAP